MTKTHDGTEGQGPIHDTGDSDVDGQNDDQHTGSQDAGDSGTSPADWQALVREQSEAFKRLSAALSQDKTATTPEGPSQDEIAKRQVEIMSTYDELCKEGKFSEAAAFLMRENTKLQPKSDPTKAPAYGSLYKSAQRAIKSDYPDLFKEFGDEIKAEVDSMDPASRIDPDKWEEAVRRVRARHFDTLLEREVKRREEKAKAERDQKGRFTGTASARGRHGEDADDSDLDEGEIEAARLLDMSHEEYKKARKETQTARIERGMHRGMVRVLDDKVQPGYF